MTKKTYSEAKLIERVRCIIKDNQYVTVSICAGADGKITLTITKMYEYMGLTFDLMMKISEILGTTEFNVNNYDSGGCETCDYGSNYALSFTFEGELRKP